MQPTSRRGIILFLVPYELIKHHTATASSMLAFSVAIGSGLAYAIAVL